MLTIRIAILLVNGVIRVREGRLTEAWRGRPYNSYVKKKNAIVGHKAKYFKLEPIYSKQSLQFLARNGP